VNQPIAAAVANASACLHWLAAQPPNLDEARAPAMNVVKDGTRAAEIVSHIRLLFKKAAPQRELVDLNEVIREMIVLPAQRSDAMLHIGPHRAGWRSSARHRRPRATAAGDDEPHHQQYRGDEGCGREARASHQVAASGGRANCGVYQR
jgi:hypothetical protein